MTEAHSAALHAGGRHAVFAGLNFLRIKKKSDGVACEIVLALHPWRGQGLILNATKGK